MGEDDRRIAKVTKSKTLTTIKMCKDGVEWFELELQKWF